MARKKPNRKRVRHFSAKDAARCVAYARRDGADDAELAKYIIYSFGVGDVPCLISQAVLLASQAILLGVLFKLVRGIMYFLRGFLMLINAVEESFIGYMLSDFLVFLESEFGWVAPAATKAQWLMWVGAIQTGLASTILFFDGFADTIIYYRFLDVVCSKKIPAKPYKIIPKPLV